MTKPRFRWSVLIAVLAIALVAASCGDDEEPAPDTSAADAAALEQAQADAAAAEDAAAAAAAEADAAAAEADAAAAEADAADARAAEAEAALEAARAEAEGAIDPDVVAELEAALEAAAAEADAAREEADAAAAEAAAAEAAAVAAEEAAAAAEIVGVGETARINWSGFPENYLPGADFSIGYLRIANENLVVIGQDGSIQPQLATSWEYTSPTTLQLNLREGVLFHDGTPFNSEAVKVSIEAIAAADTDIAGPARAITEVEIIDDLTVALHTDGPSPSLLLTLTTLSTLIHSPTAIADGTLLTQPVGTGPWAYNADTSSPGTRLNFDYFDDYWGGRASVGFDHIELYGITDLNAGTGALETGQIDLTYTEPEFLDGFTANPETAWLQYPAIRNGMVFFDYAPGGVFSDVRVRQAACHAMNNVETAAFTGSLPQTQTFLAGQVGHIEGFDGFPHDPDRAAELLAEAGNPTVAAESLATFFTRDQVTVFLDQLNQVDGFDVAIQVVPPPQWFGQWDSGQYELGVGSQQGLHPADWFNRYFAAEAHPSGYASDELQAAADAATAAGTGPEADALWTEVSRIVHEDALTCARMTGPETLVWRTDRLAGVRPATFAFEPKLIDYRNLRPAS